MNAYGLNDHEQARFSWERFCDIVMHWRRFFFLDENRDEDDFEVYNPREVLHTIFEYGQQMGLFQQIPPGTQLFRARWEVPNAPLETAQELGPPPLEKATQSNRMSPAGIPMLYACDDEDTALRETATSSGCFAIGRFETLRPATLLDFTAIPPVPSLFEPVPDSPQDLPRRVLTFLHHVAEQISRPIERSDRAHIDYVPTQVITEFVRNQLTWEGSRIDGIKYDSSVHEGHASYVFFATQENILARPENRSSKNCWLKLAEAKHRWCDASWLPNQPSE